MLNVKPNLSDNNGTSFVCQGDPWSAREWEAIGKYVDMTRRFTEINQKFEEAMVLCEQAIAERNQAQREANVARQSAKTLNDLYGDQNRENDELRAEVSKVTISLQETMCSSSKLAEKHRGIISTMAREIAALKREVAHLTAQLTIKPAPITPPCSSRPRKTSSVKPRRRKPMPKNTSNASRTSSRRS